MQLIQAFGSFSEYKVNIDKSNIWGLCIPTQIQATVSLREMAGRWSKLFKNKNLQIQGKHDDDRKYGPICTLCMGEMPTLECLPSFLDGAHSSSENGLSLQTAVYFLKCSFESATKDLGSNSKNH